MMSNLPQRSDDVRVSVLLKYFVENKRINNWFPSAPSNPANTCCTQEAAPAFVVEAT
jgi:hypothetical protein